MAGSTGERKIMHSVVVRRFESRVSNRCLMDGDAYPLFPILPQSRSIVVPGRHSSLSLSLSLHAHRCLSRRPPLPFFFVFLGTKVTPRTVCCARVNSIPCVHAIPVCYSRFCGDEWPIERTASNSGPAMIYRVVPKDWEIRKKENVEDWQCRWLILDRELRRWLTWELE